MKRRSIDWHNTGHAERQILHQHCKALNQAEHMSFDRLFERAFGRNAVGKDYVRGFRRGEIGVKKSIRIYELLRAEYPAVADAVEDAVAAYWAQKQSKAELTWEELLVQHARYGNVAIKPAPAELDIVRFRDDGPVAEFTPRVGEFFYFEIACRMGGHLCAFQGSEGSWYPVPLRRDRMTAKAIEGTMALPTDKSGKRIDPLYENDDGRHSFVFVAVEDAKLLNTVGTLRAGRIVRDGQLDEFATALANVDDDAFAVDRVNVHVRPT
ncbi:MAG: hypothetical protein ROR55_02960 [Devosia sp.]